LFWDGAVVANTPLRPAIDEGAEDIYVVLLSPPGARELPAPAHLHDAAAYAFDLALLASFEADQKQVDKINQQVAEGRAKPEHRDIRLHVIAPSQAIPAAWIMTYDPKNTDHLIRMGYADAQLTIGP
jgi:NTE family protein